MTSNIDATRSGPKRYNQSQHSNLGNRPTVQHRNGPHTIQDQSSRPCRDACHTLRFVSSPGPAIFGRSYNANVVKS